MARDFSPANSHLKYTGAILSDEPISMACWFNMPNITSGHPLMGIAFSSGGDDFFMLNAHGGLAGDPIIAMSKRGFATWAETSAGFSANTWHHGCAVFAADNDRRAYLDGGGKGTDTTSKAPANLNVTSIGGVLDSTPTYAGGPIAEAVIYNCVLTDTEVALFHHRRYSALKIRPQNIVAYYALKHGDNADWMGRYPMLAVNTPLDIASPPIVYPERDDPVWGLVLPRYRPRRYWVVVKTAAAGNPWYYYAQQH